MMSGAGTAKSNRLFASVIGLLLFIAVQFVVFIDYGVTVAHNASSSATPASHRGATSMSLSNRIEVDRDSTSLTATPMPTTLLGERPMRRREWKPYLKEKYADVLASTLRFELVALFTPERAPDDEPHDPNYHMDNAPRRTAKIYRKWLEMQAEIAAHDEAIRLWKAARGDKNDDDDVDDDKSVDADVDADVDLIESAE
jgi:hypothetical protein